MSHARRLQPNRSCVRPHLMMGARSRALASACLLTASMPPGPLNVRWMQLRELNMSYCLQGLGGQCAGGVHKKGGGQGQVGSECRLGGAQAAYHKCIGKQQAI